MPKELIDDQLWSLIEPLLSKQVPRRPKASARPSSAHWYRIRAALGNCVEPDAAGNGLWLRYSLLATACRMGKAGVWQRIHETLLAELRRRDEIDLTRAIVDSSSIRAMLAGKKLARIPRTDASSAASTTSSSTRKVSQVRTCR